MKETLKTVFLKGLPDHPDISKIARNKELSVNEKGEISFNHTGEAGNDFDTAMKLINFLASKLADAEIDLWLQTKGEKW